MVDITVLEVNLPDSAFSANLPFGGSNRFSDEDEPVDAAPDSEEDESGGNKALAIVGTFVFLVIAVAAVKYLRGDDGDHEVEIETPEEPVGVTIDDEE